MSLLIRSVEFAAAGVKRVARTVFGAAATAISKGTGDEYVRHGGRGCGYHGVARLLGSAGGFALSAEFGGRAVPDRPQAERSNLRGAAWWFSESPATMQLLLDLSNGVRAEEAGRSGGRRIVIFHRGLAMVRELETTAGDDLYSVLVEAVRLTTAHEEPIALISTLGTLRRSSARRWNRRKFDCRVSLVSTC